MEVKFSERVRLPDSAAATLFANTGATNVAVPTAVRLSPDGTTLTIEPTGPFPAPAAYSVRLGDIRDEAGNALVLREWIWRVPLWLRVGQPLEGAGDISSSMIVAGPDEQVTVGSTVTVNFPLQRLLVHTIQHSNGRWSLLDNRLKIDGRIAPSLFLDNKPGLSALISVQENHIVVEQWLDTKWQEHSIVPPMNGIGDALTTQAKNGERFLAYTAYHAEQDGSTDIIVTQGRAWSQLGGPVNGDDAIGGVGLGALSLDRNGTPYVAYSTGSYKGRIRYWSQGSWTLLAPTVTSPGDKTDLLEIAVDDGGTPFALLAISDGATTYKNRFQIRRFDGNHWIDCGNRLVPADDDIQPYFFGQALDGHIFAAAVVRSTGDRVPDKLLTFDVTKDGWTTIAPPVDTLPQYTRISAAIDSRGAPILAWNEGTTVHLRRLNR